MRRTISNSDDVVDSRDVIARIDELEAEQETLLATIRELESGSDGEAYDVAKAEFDNWEEDYGEELDGLRSLADEANGSADWHHGETLINDSYFEDYARELANDIGAIDAEAGWPCNCIDWEAAAEQLQQDYTSVEWDGVTFWIRS